MAGQSCHRCDCTGLVGLLQAQRKRQSTISSPGTFILLRSVILTSFDIITLLPGLRMALQIQFTASVPDMILSDTQTAQIIDLPGAHLTRPSLPMTVKFKSFLSVVVLPSG